MTNRRVQAEIFYTNHLQINLDIVDQDEFYSNLFLARYTSHI